MLTATRLHDIYYVIRPSPPLAPGDSLAKATRLLRARNAPLLLVADGHQLVGCVHEAGLLELALRAPEAIQARSGLTVAEVMRPIELILAPYQSLAEAAREMTAAGLAAAPVADAGGRYLGLIFRRDVLAALSGEPVVPTIAGLATPFGVHLTTGALRAGASDLALASTGAALMAMNYLALGAVEGAEALLPKSLSVPPGVLAGLLGVLQIVLFLLLLRYSPVSRIHAGEHMVVRAIEEGEDLALEKVRPMPRAHPRCGTNLVALMVLVAGAESVLGEVRSWDSAAADTLLFALILVVLFTWRRLGQGLQRWITTRDPSDRQLAGAIAVGESLLQQVRESPGATVGPWRRVWNMGFVQVMTGAAAVAGLVYLGGLVYARIVQ